MKRAVFLIIAGGLVLSLMGCGKDSTSNNAAVQSVSALCGYSAAGAVNQYSGVVTSQKEVKVKKNKDLTIAEVMVSQGDEVEAGQILFRYDADQVQMNLEKAQLELEQYVNQADSATKQIAKLEKEQQSASTSDQVLEYSLQIQEQQNTLDQANYNSKVKQKEVDKIQAQLNSLDVTAPVTGMIKSIADDSDSSTSTAADSSSTTSSSGDDAYIVITQTGDLQVKGYVNENNMGILTEGMSVTLRSRLDENQTWKGTISEIDWNSPVNTSSSSSAGTTSDETSTVSNSSKYPFYVELESTDGLLMGQHLYIEPVLGGEENESSEIVLSAGFINDADGAAWVWAENAGGELEKRSVTLGDYEEAQDRYVIAGGLSLEDYVAYPENGLSEGMTCVEYNTISNTDAADAGAADAGTADADAVDAETADTDSNLSGDSANQQ